MAISWIWNIIYLYLFDYYHKIDSSDESKEVPWIDCKEAPPIVFNGFEEAATNDVNELTRIITSHHLYLDILGNS